MTDAETRLEAEQPPGHRISFLRDVERLCEAVVDAAKAGRGEVEGLEGVKTAAGIAAGGD